MRQFNYSLIKDQKWDSDLLGLIAAIYREAGKQEMYLKHSSLDAFCSKFSSKILRKYLINTKAPAKDLDVECLPPYMVPFL